MADHSHAGAGATPAGGVKPVRSGWWARAVVVLSVIGPGIITIGTPHHGSVLACTFPGRCLAQMRPGNAWLAELNRDEAAPYPVPITSIWSRHDSMVAPQASSELACAQNVAVVGIGHNALLNAPEVLERIARGIVVAGFVVDGFKREE